MSINKDMFDCYIDATNPTFSVTVELEVSNALLEHKHPSHVLMKAVAYAINEVEEFKYRLDKDNNIVKFDTISLGYTVLKRIGGFNLAITEFNELHNLKMDIKNALMRDDFHVEGGDRLDLFYMSVLPSIKFTGFSNPVKGNNYDSVPIVIIGKVSDNRVPISITAHHGFVDGISMSRFISVLQEELIK